MERNKSLFHISNELRELVELATYDEMDEESIAKLEIAQQELSEKLVGYNFILDEMSGMKDIAIKEIKRIQTYLEGIEKAENRLKYAMLKAVMEFGDESKTGVKKLKVGTHTFSTRKSKRVTVEDEVFLDDKYRRVKCTINLESNKLNALIKFLQDNNYNYSTIKSIDKTAIKNILASGGKVDNASLETYYNLTIK